MNLQLRLRVTLAAVLVIAGCHANGTRSRSARFVQVDATGDVPGIRLYESEHYRLHTTLGDATRVGPIIATLEAANFAYERAVGFQPRRRGAPRMDVYVFERRAEWEAFTTRRLGRSAPLYLQLDRGGYAAETFCAVREQGEHATLRVLAHEGFHLFIATRFNARPPPFIEEGLATQFETVQDGEFGVRIQVGENAARSARLNWMFRDKSTWRSLRQLLTMHAGEVVGKSRASVDAFYGQAWAFVHFLLRSNDERLRDGFARMLADAASGALSSESLEDNPALVERYLGRSLEQLDGPFRSFAERLAAPPLGER